MKIRYLLPVFVFLFPALDGAQAQQKAQQQTAPVADRWCRDQSLDHGSVQICFAYTYEQCMASRTGNNESICYLNPRYDPRHRG